MKKITTRTYRLAKDDLIEAIILWLKDHHNQPVPDTTLAVIVTGAQDDEIQITYGTEEDFK